MKSPVSRRHLLRLGAASLAAMPLVIGAARAESAQQAALSEEDRIDVARIEDYLNGLSTVKANFQQIVQKEVSFGRIYLRRPGRLRVEYDPPSEILLVADGTLLSYYDAELNHIEQVPLNLSPMWFLLRQNVKLGGDVTVTQFKRNSGNILIGLVQSDEPDAGSVQLEFGDKPLELQHWTIIDSAGTEVQVGIYDSEFGAQLPNELFATPRKKPRNTK